MAGLGQPAPGAMPPGAMPPGGPPPGMMPRPPGMPGMPPGGPPMGGPGGMMPPMPPPPAAQPFSDPFVDVSDALPVEYQIIDASSRMLKKAVETGAFYKTPDVLAWLKNTCKEADRIVTSYSGSKSLDISGSPMGDDAKIVEPDDSSEDEEE